MQGITVLGFPNPALEVRQPSSQLMSERFCVSKPRVSLSLFVGCRMAWFLAFTCLQQSYREMGFSATARLCRGGDRVWFGSLSCIEWLFHFMALAEFQPVTPTQ